MWIIRPCLLYTSCLCYEISDRDGMDKSREAIQENVDFIKHALADDSDMIAGMMGMQDVYKRQGRGNYLGSGFEKSRRDGAFATRI